MDVEDRTNKIELLLLINSPSSKGYVVYILHTECRSERVGTAPRPVEARDYPVTGV